MPAAKHNSQPTTRLTQQTNDDDDNRSYHKAGWTKQGEKLSVEEYNTNKKLNINNSSISLWTERWFWSSNAKDIGTLYLIFALLSGLVGTAFSVLIRLELSGPGVQFIADNQLYNSIITAHAIVMIFFMVKKNAYMLNTKSNVSSTLLYHTKIEKGYDIKVGNDNNTDNKDFKPKEKYVKILV